MRQRVFLIGLLCCSYFAAMSQGEKYLVLDKPGHIKRFRYYVGDEIIFKLNGDKMTYKDVIQAVTDSTIKVRDTEIPIKEIASVIRYKQGGMLKQAIFILPRAGILYFLADTFNPVFKGYSPNVSRSGVIVGSSFVASSFLLRTLKKKKYHINNFRRLRTLETF